MRRRWKEARRWAKNPEAVKDWAWRAMHLSVIAAKDVVEAYYGQEIQYSYYNGCSNGGRQGLKEVQTFPDDFDGAVIGAPAWWTVHLQLWNIQTSCFRFWLRRVSGTPEKMNAPWYIGGTTQASVIGGDSAGYWIHNQPGFHNP